MFASKIKHLCASGLKAGLQSFVYIIAPSPHSWSFLNVRNFATPIVLDRIFVNTFLAYITGNHTALNCGLQLDNVELLGVSNSNISRVLTGCFLRFKIFSTIIVLKKLLNKYLAINRGEKTKMIKILYPKDNSGFSSFRVLNALQLFRSKGKSNLRSQINACEYGDRYFNGIFQYIEISMHTHITILLWMLF